MAIKHTDY